MSILILFAAVIAALCVWILLLQRFRTKPWLVTGTEPETSQFSAKLAKKMGFWVFLGVITSLFALFSMAYAMRMKTGDWQPVPEPGILWLNTIFLVASSLSLQGAVYAAGRRNERRLKMMFSAGGLLAVAFVAGQLRAWQILVSGGYSMDSNPADAFFFLLTALHGIHLMGGLWVWTRTTVKAFYGSELGEIRLSIELCAQYWHYLLILWLLLFALLKAT